MEGLILENSVLGSLAAVTLIVVLVFLYMYLRRYRKVTSSSRAKESMAAGTKIKWQEKREDLRMETKLPVTIETADGFLNEEMINVSTGGAFICCRKLPRLKETFQLTTNPPNYQPLTVTAEVVWSNFSVPESDVINRGMGVRFLEISDEDRQFISETVADHQ